MGDPLGKLLDAIRTGAVLASIGAAGCSSVGTPQDSGATDSGREPLAAYDGGDLGCIPDSGYPGFTSDCCIGLHCYEPDAGEACVPATEVRSVFGNWAVGAGSGTCNCRQPHGPYGPGDADAGSCCYVWGVNQCVGRPLLLDGEMVLAKVVQRSDWIG